MEAEPQQAEPVEANPAEAAVQPKRKRGASGHPRGVAPCARGGRFQARVSYKPLGAAKAVQRSVGTFDTVEEAAAAVLAAEEQLKAGNDPWQQPARKNQHARGEVRRLSPHTATLSSVLCVTFVLCAMQAPSPQRKTERRHGVITKPKQGGKKDKEERDPQLPTTVPLPTRVEDVMDPGMRAMWEQEQAKDGEVAPELLGS